MFFNSSLYQYPKKIIWDQTSEFIEIKVALKNVKNIDIIYGKESISFRLVETKLSFE